MTHAVLHGRGPVLRALGRPRLVAFACIALLAAAGWAYLGLVLAGRSAQGGILQALCQPLFGAPGTTGVAGLLLTLAMWAAMVLAMMLPTAGPMIATYADIAETAEQKGETVVSPLVLAAGYLVVWLGAAMALTLIQALLSHFAVFDETLSRASSPIAGGLFVVAGLYQFSAIKRACLTLCQHPFTFFFANWTPQPLGVFRLGLRQGLYCLGCCWAMMLLMFAVGVMSVVWMAMLGIVMAIEKLGPTMRFSRIVGAIFLAVGVAIVLEWIVRQLPAAM